MGSIEVDRVKIISLLAQALVIYSVSNPTLANPRTPYLQVPRTRTVLDKVLNCLLAPALVPHSSDISSHLIAQAINDGNQLELWKFLYEKCPSEGRLQAVAELLKFSRKPAPPIDSETEYDSDGD
jgi:hypothetical protein